MAGGAVGWMIGGGVGNIVGSAADCVGASDVSAEDGVAAFAPPQEHIKRIKAALKASRWENAIRLTVEPPAESAAMLGLEAAFRKAKYPECESRGAQAQGPRSTTKWILPG
jgi:hypothetical protein